MMKAAVLRAPGGFDRIKVHDVPDPHQPGLSQIRIASMQRSTKNKEDQSLE